MKLIVDLNISWRNLVVSPKDFVTLCEIMDRSVVVDRQYTNENTYYVIEDKRLIESRSVADGVIVTSEQMAAIHKAADDAKQEAETHD